MLLSRWPASSMYWRTGLYLPRCWTWHFGTLQTEEKTFFYLLQAQKLSMLMSR